MQNRRQVRGPKTWAAWAFALVLCGVMPARAGFFEDLGDALNKAADGVSDVARDVTRNVKDALKNPDADQPDKKEADKKEADPSPDTIHWNQSARVAPEEEEERGGGEGGRGGTSKTPSSATSPRFVGGPRPSPYAHKGDDAPPPRAAPRRAAVSTVASLAPLPGFSEAASAPSPPRYAPAYKGTVRAPAPPPTSSSSSAHVAASATVAPVPAPNASTSGGLPASVPAPVSVSIPAPVPVPVPVALVTPPTHFKLTFARQRLTLKDDPRETGQLPLPDKATRALIKVVADQAKTPGQRVRLVAEASAPDGAVGAARLRAYARAQRVQAWLVEAGLRSTQVDLKLGVSASDTLALEVYKDP